MLKIVFVTDSDLLVGKNFGASTRAFFVFVRPKHKDNKALLEHEFVHVHQFWRTLGLSPFLYLLSKKYRLKAEVEAYIVQLQTHFSVYGLDPSELDAKRWIFAGFIASKYKLNISKEEAYSLLKWDV